jgi:plasmid stabilization system protein ParE
MKPFKLSPEAAQDIREIWAYVAADSVRAARRVRLLIFNACQRVADNPGIGHSREDLTDKPVLFWPASSYLIFAPPESLSKSFAYYTVRVTFQACSNC